MNKSRIVSTKFYKNYTKSVERARQHLSILFMDELPKADPEFQKGLQEAIKKERDLLNSISFDLSIPEEIEMFKFSGEVLLNQKTNDWAFVPSYNLVLWHDWQGKRYVWPKSSLTCGFNPLHACGM